MIQQQIQVHQPLESSSAAIEDQIKIALVNSLSMNEVLRNQSLEFLTTHCETNPELQLALLNIIAKNYQLPGSTPQDATMLQYQAIMFMKNSLNRLFQANRNKKIFKQNGPQLTDQLKEEIKAQLLHLIQNPDGIILMEKSYEQLTLVAAIFVNYDFPGNWTQLNLWLLQMFDQLFQSLGSLQIEQVPQIKRFLNFYLEVMNVQNKKKLIPSKGQFHKVARDHLKQVYQVWTFFNQQQITMIFDAQTNTLTLEKFNQDLFELASKLDKCLQLVIACGFSLHDLLGEPKNNQFVRTTQQIIEKIQFYNTCVQKISEMDASAQTAAKKFYDLFEKQIKGLLKLTTDLQSAEPLIVFDSLGLYIETIAHILFRGTIHNERVKKLALFALYKVVNIDVYNQQNFEKQNYSDGIGILVSPSKFKNFEPQVSEARSQYQFILEKPDPTSKDPRAVNRKDGAREILKMIFQFYLPIGENIQSWTTDPESFIELEDENYFINDFDLDSNCSLNFLAHLVTEKLISQMYSTCYPFIKDDLLAQYFNGSLQLQNEFTEDALLSIIGMLAKIQQKLPQDKILDIQYVLAFVEKNKFQNPIFKRRYTHLLTQWVKILPKQRLMDYFRVLVVSLQEITDHVLIYEHCRCIHELIKEIEFWIKKEKSGNRASYAQGSLFDSGNSPITEEEEQIQMSIKINKEIDYTQLFSLVASKTIPIMSVFQAPTLIWNMINYLTLLLEKNSDSQSLMTECFHALNLQHLLSLDQKLIDEAILDMLKNLFALQPTSAVILQMCISVLDYKLSKKPDSMVVQFWLFTTRAVSMENPSIENLKFLFQKYAGYGDLKKDYMVIDFLKIVQEYVMLNFFSTQEDLTSLIGYIHQKIIQEIQLEVQWVAKNQLQEASNGNQIYSDTSSEDYSETNIYEKKLNLIAIAHIVLQRAQSEAPEVLHYVLECLKEFILTISNYFIDFKAHKNMPQSSLFFTQAVTFIDRIIVLNRDFFLNQIMEPLCTQKGITFAAFVEAWFGKMEMIVSQESRRINLLAIYNVLPYFGVELLQKSFNEIGRLTFSILDSFFQTRLLNGGDSAFCSPSKVAHYNVISTKVKINMMEKVSQRMENLKSVDALLEIDIVDFFWKRMDETARIMQIQPNLLILNQYVSDEAYRQIFTNLISAAPGSAPLTFAPQV